jgi:hypothetical protein
LGASAALLTTQLANIIPAGGAAARMTCTAGMVAVAVYATSLAARFWLPEPGQSQLPD